VPRNRADVDRDSKIAEILNAAEAALEAGGYDALSHSQVARDVCLTRGAVYWYFPTKDDLIVAALGPALTKALGRPPNTDDYVMRIAWAVERLARLQPLTAALHERARHSAAAADLQAELKASLYARLRAVLAPHVEPTRLEQVADTLVVLIDGLLARQRSKAEQGGARRSKAEQGGARRSKAEQGGARRSKAEREALLRSALSSLIR
jgi:AcrR family transcriptional regulator